MEDNQCEQDKVLLKESIKLIKKLKRHNNKPGA